MVEVSGNEKTKMKRLSDEEKAKLRAKIGETATAATTKRVSGKLPKTTIAVAVIVPFSLGIYLSIYGKTTDQLLSTKLAAFTFSLAISIVALLVRRMIQRRKLEKRLEKRYTSK